MSVELPPSLAEAVDDLLTDTSPRDLARASADLSARYREKRQRSAPIARSQADMLAYLAVRLPATYAAVSAALAAAEEQRPGWQPRSVLDLGAGPGTALWSAASRWPSVERMVGVESEPGMLALGRRLAASGPPAVRAATWQQADLTMLDGMALHDLGAPFDLVILAYVLVELPSAHSESVLASAMAATAPDGLLLVVEPGTPEGFARVRTARAHLLALGGSVTAPCPHDAACPVPDGDWCHFSVRLPRTAGHRAAKGGALGYEDEKFAYAAITRGQAARASARVIRHPQIRPRLIQLSLCTLDGLEARTVTKSDREAFRAARKAAWGDAWASEP